MSLRAYLKRRLAPLRDTPRARQLRAAGEIGELESPACAICSGRSVKPHYTYNGFRIVQCIYDGLIFVSPRPRDVSPFYDERYYNGRFPGLYVDYSRHALSMRDEWNKRLNAIACETRAPGRIVDVGAATGEFLSLAREGGWSTAGVEPSEWAAAKARNELGLDVRTGDLPAAAMETGAADVVTMWDCIEHLDDPAGTLREARRILRPGGILAISTGAVPHLDKELSSGWYYPPWHLYYFSVETLREICDKAGFEIFSTEVAAVNTPYALVTMMSRSRGAERH